MVNLEKILNEGKRILSVEKDAIERLESKLDDSFVDAVYTILNSPGNVIFSGVGKSGHIGRKLAATFSSTGTTAFFVHADEAAHGDLGMIQKGDVFVGISFSGESDELLTLIPALKAMNVSIIAMTGKRNSTLAKVADCTLVTEIEKEACPLNLAPTASTTVTLALGDALAGACMVAKNFNADDFARSHPAGALGRRLLLKVSDIMRTGELAPVVSPSASAVDAIKEMSRKHLGTFVVIDECKKPVGIFTEGDLCRLILKAFDFRDVTAESIMKKSPITIMPDVSAYSALKIIKEKQVNQLVVVDSEGLFLGVIHIQDLVARKIY